MDKTDRFGVTPARRRPGHVKGVRIAVAPTEQVTALSTRFQLEGRVVTWRDLQAAMAKKTGIRMGLGTLYDLGKGIDPKSNRLRRALDLPELGQGAICPVHGKVCAVQHRLAADKPAKPRRQWKPVAKKGLDLLARVLIATADDGRMLGDELRNEIIDLVTKELAL